MNMIIKTIELKKTNTHDQKIHKIFQIIRYMIFDYFIDPESKFKCEFSNKCIDLIHLGQCSKTITDLLIKQYIKKGCFHFLNIQNLSDIKRSWIRNFVHYQNSHNETKNNMLNYILNNRYIHRLIYYCRDLDLIEFISLENLQDLKIIECESSRNRILHIKTNHYPNNLIKLCISTYLMSGDNTFIIDELPPTLTDLDLNGYKLQSQTIDLDWFPKNLQILRMPYYYNQCLVPNLLPTNLHTLELGLCFDQKIEFATLPPTITDLTFGENFNQILEPYTLPGNITVIKFGIFYNQQLRTGSLPVNLLKLTFCQKSIFNKVFEKGSLPANLKTLNLGNAFNQLIDVGILPTTLTCLFLGNDFDQPFKPQTLPGSLIDLSINSRYSHSLNCILPDLKILTFNYQNDMFRTNHITLNSDLLPKSLEQLTIISPYFNQSFIEPNGNNLLPSGLKELNLNIKYCMNQRFIDQYAKRILPLSLKKLIFSEKFMICYSNEDLKKVEEKVRQLEFCQSNYLNGTWIFKKYKNKQSTLYTVCDLTWSFIKSSIYQY